MPETLLERHITDLTILILFVILVITLIILVPQLLRAHLYKVELLHQEHLRALEQGQALPPADESARLAGRTALLVPIVVMITAGTVTCFLAVYKQDDVLGVALVIWSVAGIVSLAAITGGVALLGRLAQLREGIPDENPAPEKEKSH